MKCSNKIWNADKLEAMVWEDLQRYLGNRDLIMEELEKQREDTGQVTVYETELEHLQRQTKSLDKEQHQLL